MMKKLLSLFILTISCFSFAQQQTVSYSVSPSTFEETDNITITFDGSSINEAAWGVTGNALYLWAWSFDLNLANIQDCPTNGSWTNSDEANRLTYNSGSDTYTISFVPSTFYSRTGIGRIGFLVKAKDGTGDKKSQDITVDVGAFQVVLNSPANNSTTILSSGDNFSITAQNTGGNANYTLRANGAVLDTQNGISNYSYTHTNITANQTYELEVDQGGSIITKNFSALVDPGTTFAVMSMDFEDGINYDSTDPTKATLVLYAPGKDFVYVSGSFNNWQPNTSYAMKRDPTRSSKFWVELTGLTSQKIETFQYWVVDKTPAANSPSLVKTADPFSTLVLSPFDDPFIPSSTYPNLPAYPSGQEREVTVLQTGQTEYPWVVTNFTKPKKEDLIVYEVLIRDFDANRNYQDLIDRIDYFKNLNVNAIQLMPIMEFEGNESWGYNTSFHMALDKFYGTSDKFKEFVDLCHQNGIAVILDIALNHAFGRNPLVRMWMDDADGDGWGEPASDNPYFNTAPTHSYNVGSDFDHSSTLTKDYTKRVTQYWIEEFKIDGFRWDLTKGFTQNCSSADEGCTNAFQADRVAVLKEYADHTWTIDDDHYVIFEHLGTDAEEQEWANYRIAEGKGIMMWGKMTDQYNQLTMGYNTNADIDRMGSDSHGFTANRLMGYAESHDEERLMYKNLQFGNATVGSHDVTDLDTALSRMSALGATSIMIPGPKMIWHFAALGMENSIFTCTNGTVNTNTDATAGDCKLDTKPQPQWANNWLSDTNRSQIYNDWSRLIDLKINEDVFEGDYTISSYNNNDYYPIIHISDATLPNTGIKDVIVVANFNVTTQSIVPGFPYTGTWYDLMDNSVLNVSSTTDPISIPAGQFRIFGNNATTLSVDSIIDEDRIAMYPNPSASQFAITKNVEQVHIFDISGKLVKVFEDNFNAGYVFTIDDLSRGIYFVKVKFEGKQNTLKLIKE